jgi:hypothetical protein
MLSELRRTNISKSPFARRQRFTCPACGLELERVVDAEGFGVELEDS